MIKDRTKSTVKLVSLVHQGEGGKGTERGGRYPVSGTQLPSCICKKAT